MVVNHIQIMDGAVTYVPFGRVCENEVGPDFQGKPKGMVDLAAVHVIPILADTCRSYRHWRRISI
jgi:hypothetical protein